MLLLTNSHTQNERADDVTMTMLLNRSTCSTHSISSVQHKLRVIPLCANALPLPKRARHITAHYRRRRRLSRLIIWPRRACRHTNRRTNMVAVADARTHTRNAAVHYGTVPWHTRARRYGIWAPTVLALLHIRTRGRCRSVHVCVCVQHNRFACRRTQTHAYRI